ncbi:MAG: hypothetical protein MJZ77_06000 [Bacteroidales bacterium]|nr:hypothetical protein [Bacteroidales bacterium]
MKNSIYIFKHQGNNPETGWQFSGIFGQRVPAEILNRLLSEKFESEAKTINIESVRAEYDPSSPLSEYDYYIDTCG